MNAHTPGPWSVEPLQWDRGASIAIVSSGKDGYIVATIAPENEEDEPDMHTAKRGPCDEANARLMAASPTMIYALELADAEKTDNVLRSELGTLQAVINGKQIAWENAKGELRACPYSPYSRKSVDTSASAIINKFIKALTRL